MHVRSGPEWRLYRGCNSAVISSHGLNCILLLQISQVAETLRRRSNYRRELDAQVAHQSRAAAPEPREQDVPLTGLQIGEVHVEDS